MKIPVKQALVCSGAAFALGCAALFVFGAAQASADKAGEAIGRLLALTALAGVLCGWMSAKSPTAWSWAKFAAAFALTAAVLWALAEHGRAMAAQAPDAVAEEDATIRAELARYAALVRREPGNTRALVEWADLLYANHRAGEAVPLWTRALALDRRLARVHWSLGVVHGERGDLDAEQSAYLAALDADPDFVAARINLAALYRTRHQLGEAEREYRTILRRQPGAGSVAHHGLGQVLAEQQRWTEAIAEFRADLRAANAGSAYGNALTRVDLAEALRNSGRLDEAAQTIDAALQFFNTRERVSDATQWRPPPAAIARANLESAYIRARQGNVPEALHAVAQALGHDPALLERIDTSEDLEAVRASAQFRKLASGAQARREQAFEAQFVARVRSVELIGQRAATVAASENDARWLLTIEITAIHKTAALFEKPGEALLAIHSPARLLARSAQSAAGKSYVFQVYGEMRDGKAEYYAMQAREMDD